MRSLSSIKPWCGYSIIPIPNYISLTLGTVNYLKAAGKADFVMKWCAE